MLTIAAINQENINYDDISSFALLLTQIKQIAEVVEEVRQKVDYPGRKDDTIFNVQTRASTVIP